MDEDLQLSIHFNSDGTFRLDCPDDNRDLVMRYLGTLSLGLEIPLEPLGQGNCPPPPQPVNILCDCERAPRTLGMAIVGKTLPAPDPGQAT